MSLRIARLGDSTPAVFAAQELRRYLMRMAPGEDVAILSADAYDPAREETLWVGEDAAFDARLPKVCDRTLDDGIWIDVEAGAGVVTGTNARSVLLAVYRLLVENGCAFLHPGRDGERVPERSLAALSAKVCEKADNRHRGVCIEGAVGYDHVLNMIDFLPKVGMNAYFIQFFVPKTFFDRWYSHEFNPSYAPPYSMNRDEIEGLKRALTEEIQKRGLMYHAVGHGWTCEPLGIEGDGWETQQPELSEDVRALLAEVNGTRGLWNGVGLNTNLCYGNPEARRRITEAIADYCAAHPEVDYLHFWLADDANNHCECPLCRDTLPSDFYVQMLNELDEIMTARGVDTKVVFLIYVDLLWAPQTQKIAHPDRFVLMFAPITRTYSAPFVPDQSFEGTLTAYRRNRNVMPTSVAENVARLRSWQKSFHGDGFDFDYHFMWDHHKDLGGMQTAEILMQDMKNLRDIGLNGMISCQNQRVFFPTALGMHAMAEALWNREADFGDLTERYFDCAYGEMGKMARDYLKSVTEDYDPPYLRGEREMVSPAQAKRYEALLKRVDAFEPIVDAQIEAQGDSLCVAEWCALKLHCGLIRRMSKMLLRLANGENDGARAAWMDAKAYVQRIEPKVHERFDGMEFILTYERFLKSRGVL